MTDDNWTLHRPFHGRPYMRRPKGGGWERRPITSSDPEWRDYADWLKWMAEPIPEHESRMPTPAKIAAVLIGAFFVLYGINYCFAVFHEIAR